ncbi:PEFG-CTERM sorting domain-containing protein [Nitrosopumilus sp.]|uniref:PEFG-CTERM sorting domain-containing protein n=1 Tax=Nitrosopumilus sp. TaxID=2024843 RepID=UPI00292F5F71|nr:PEFG-CTERM sorting domain-containing protein [Nitrosopumilus sp.]
MKITTKTTTMTFFSVIAIVAAGLLMDTTSITIPAAYAETTVSLPEGTSVPGCEETDACYIPSSVSVGVGETVTWSNDDTAAHTVTSGTASGGPDGIFDSSLFAAGTTFSHTFEEEGAFDYFCMVHPWMVGAVTVGTTGTDAGTGGGVVDNGNTDTNGSDNEELMVEIATGDTAAQGEMLSIDVTFKTLDGMGVEHVNYDIMATQGTETVLDDKGVHDHDGVMNHMTAPLPAGASDEMPVDITVTFNGFGVDEPFTGPTGQVATKQVVPEFGTIAMMILAVAIISIVAISAKSRLSITPRL